jgi:hypothetical protein
MRNWNSLMTQNAKHWANNFAGFFLVTVMMFVIVIAVSQSYPSSGTALVLWLLGAIGVVSLVAWTWLANVAGGQAAERALFKIH